MITQDFRPKTFDEMAGQSLVKRILKSIVKNPDKSPHSMILQGEYGSGKCVDYNTRVYTNSGYKRIGDLYNSPKEGFNSMSISIKSDIGWEYTSHFYTEDNCKINYLNTSRGYSVNGTDKHKVLAFKNNKVTLTKISELNVGDYLLMNRIPLDNSNNEITEDIAYALGAWLGSGYCTKDEKGNTIYSFISNDFNLADKVSKCLGLVLHDKTIKEGGKTTYTYKSKSDSNSILCTLYSTFCTSENKFVSEIIYESSLNSRVAFIRGLLDTNGCIKDNLIFNTKSKLLSEGIKDILITLGISVSIEEKDINNILYYSVIILNTHKGQYDILNQYKGIKQIPSNTSTVINTIEVTDEFVDDLLSHMNSLSYRCEVEYYNKCINDIKNNKKVDEETLINILNEVGSLPSNIKDLIGYDYVKIESIDVKVGKVYDLTVPNSHHFIAQGILNHNTTSVRILARALNCLNPKDGNPCMKCDNCLEDLNASPFYTEYDSAIIGNIDTIRELRDTFYYTIKDGWKVIVFDECFSYDTDILCYDNNKIVSYKIGDIVENNLDVQVLTLTPNGTLTTKGIVERHISTKDYTTICKFKSDIGIHFLECTPNHIIYDYNMNEVRIQDLRIGDKVKLINNIDRDSKDSNIITEEQFQILIGSLLGNIIDKDFSINNNKINNISINNINTNNNNNIDNKIDIYKDIINKILKNVDRDNISKEILDIISLYNSALDKDIISLLYKLTPLGLIFFIRGLQESYKDNIVLDTTKYSSSDRSGIIKYFNDKWGITFINIGDKLSTSSIKDTVMVQSLLAYTTLQDILDSITPIDKSNTFNYEYIECTFEDIEIVDERKKVYDLTLQGNHNYIANNILVHNCHMASRSSQNALLKVIEEAPPKVIFVFASTEIEKIIPTIRSRSLELRYDLIPEKDIINNLKQIQDKLPNEVSEDILKLIAIKSKGHMRNAHMLLDQYFMIGEKDFRESMRSSRLYFIKYFESLAKKDKNLAFQTIDELLSFPLADLRTDFDEVVLNMSQHVVGYKQYEDLNTLISLLGVDTLKIVKVCMSDWVKDGFSSDVSLQTSLLCLYQMIVTSLQRPTSSSTGNSLASRAVKR